MKDYYSILEVDINSSQEEIRSQYHLLLHAWHPDKFANSFQKSKAEERVRDINEAYSVLSNESKRKEYNRLYGKGANETQQERQYTTSSQPSASKNPTVSPCESCGLPVETKYVELYENVGMLIMRTHKHIKGNLCKACIDHYFWNFTGKTMLLGWWGIISALVTPFVLLNNSIRFLGTMGMKKPPIQVLSNPSPLWVFTAFSGYLFAGFFIFTVLSSMFAPSNFSAQPIPVISTATKAQAQPTKAKTPTLPGSNCLNWNKITPSMIGKTICVYGTVLDTKFVGESSFQVLFSSDPYDFFLAGGTYYYALNKGDCVLAQGEVLESGVGAPYIDIDEELLFCEPWMENQ